MTRRPELALLAVVVAAIVSLGGAFAGLVWLVVAAVVLAMLALVALVALVVLHREHARGPATRNLPIVPLTRLARLLPMTAAQRERRLRDVAAAVDAVAPVVLLVFSGDRSATYQVDMWLSTIEDLREPALVLLREREVFDALGPTRLPVVCVPDAEDVMALRLPTARAALFPTSVASNIHVLRLPHVLSAFIGHGDSDKNASYSPYSRVYDEIWVAGPAGRARYRSARVGVRDEDVVEVGRPQLDELSRTPASRRNAGPPTLLYAPTWEGWDVDQDHASQPTTGIALVRSVLADGRVRLVYRPHPFTGRRSATVRRAHHEIVQLLDDANRHLPVGADAHEVIRPGAASLFECFAASDVLVTDVSSVLSDYLATSRPYAVTNPSGETADAFLRRFPAARAGVLLGPAAEGLIELIDVITGVTRDDRVEARAALRMDILGDPRPEGFDRFQAAVTDLVARADARLEPPTTPPGA